jgi:Rod binding domain-containing protein
MLPKIEGLGLNALSGFTNPSFEQVAESFEAVFISQLVKSLRESFCKDLGASSGLGGDSYLYMIDQALSEGISRAGGIGIKEQLEKWANSATQEENSSEPEGSSGLRMVRSRGRV